MDTYPEQLPAGEPLPRRGERQPVGSPAPHEGLTRRPAPAPPPRAEQPAPPPHEAPREAAAARAEHQRPGDLPRRRADQPGEPLPRRTGQPPAEPMPRRGEPLPQRGGQLPQRGEPLPQRGDPDGEHPALPRRTTRTRRPGRHRSSHRLSVAPDAPPLVLAVPGTAAADTARIGPQVAQAAELSCPGVNIRVGYVDGSELTLADTLTEAVSASDQFPAVVVPMLLSPTPAVDEAIAAAVARAGVPTVLAEHLGPHPLVAEALHSRLAEAGLARTARAAGLSIAPGGRGIVVLADPGEEAMNGASVAAVLLASRLSVPVMPASLGDPPSIVTAIDRLNESGSQPVLAPCLIGTESSVAVLADLSEALGAPCAPALGAHVAVSQLVAVRYGAALATLSVPG